MKNSSAGGGKVEVGGCQRKKLIEGAFEDSFFQRCTNIQFLVVGVCAACPEIIREIEG